MSNFVLHKPYLKYFFIDIKFHTYNTCKKTNPSISRKKCFN